jgi:hypothetical protein
VREDQNRWDDVRRLARPGEQQAAFVNPPIDPFDPSSFS